MKVIMETTNIRQKLHHFIETIEDKKAEAIYTLFEDEINTVANDWDDDFIKELEQRSKGFINGTAKTYSWEETKQAAINKAKSQNK